MAISFHPKGIILIKIGPDKTQLYFTVHIQKQCLYNVQCTVCNRVQNHKLLISTMYNILRKEIYGFSYSSNYITLVTHDSEKF